MHDVLIGVGRIPLEKTKNEEVPMLTRERSREWKINLEILP